jgi:hypothetical protein
MIFVRDDPRLARLLFISTLVIRLIISFCESALRRTRNSCRAVIMMSVNIASLWEGTSFKKIASPASNWASVPPAIHS